MPEDTDDLTNAAIAEETAGPNTAVAPIPEKPAEEAAEVAAPSVQTKEDFVGEFVEPDYADVLSDKDRAEEVMAAEEQERPLDPVSPAPAPVEVPAVAPAPVAPSPSVSQSVEPPVVAAPVAAPVAEVPAAPTPTVTPSPEEQAAAQKQLEEETMAMLVKQYTLSPEEAAKLDEFERKPSEYLPTLLAKAHQNAYVQSYQTIMAALPAMVERISTVKAAERQAEEAFFNRWPELKGQDPVVMRAIATFKQMNPQSTMEETIERAGTLAMISMGKIPGSSGQPPAAPEIPQTPPPRPIMPGSGSGIRPTETRTYEEGVFEEIIRDERNFGRG